MQKTFLICAALFIVLCSGNCKKNGGTTPPGADLGDYQPLTAGSEWNYTTTGTTASGSVNSSFKVSATAKDTSANSRTYKVFTNSSGGNEYYNKSGSDYYRIASFASLSQPVDILYLKDNLALGATWTESKSLKISGIPVDVPVNFEFKVEKNKFDTTMDANTYKDVIVIRVKPSSSLAPVTSDITYYYARKTGLFLNKLAINIPLASINVNTVTKLNSYTIK